MTFKVYSDGAWTATVDVGPDYQSTAISAVTGSQTAAGSTSALAPKAGRGSYLWLSGGTSAFGYVEFSNDAGTTWFKLLVEGTQLGTFSYAAAAGSQVIPIPSIDQAGALVRVTFLTVSGSVAYSLAQ